MTTNGSAWPAYFAAAITSLLAFFATLVIVLEFAYPNLERVGLGGLHPIVVALALCTLAGILLALAWPAQWRRLAIVASSAFWGYFVLVFVFLLLEGRFDIVPLGQAVLALAATAVGTVLGRWLSPRGRKAPSSL